jgi:Protein of unknown function (DUF2934)
MNSQSTMDDEEQRVRETAYHLWEKDGRPFGQSEMYWEQARSLAVSRQRDPTAPIKADGAKKTRPKATKISRASATKSRARAAEEHAAP